MSFKILVTETTVNYTNIEFSCDVTKNTLLSQRPSVPVIYGNVLVG